MKMKVTITLPLIILIALPLFWSIPNSSSIENPNLSWEPELNSESTLIGSSSETQVNVEPLETIWDNAISIKVLFAADEEELSNSYWTPYGYYYWRLYAYDILEKVNLRLVQKFGVYFNGWEYVTWHSDNSDYVNRLYEMVNELGWRSNRVYNVLIGFTGTSMSPAYGVVDSSISAILIHWKVYWADDNLLEHELGHIFRLHDHYEGDPHYHDDCIMSKEPVWQDLWGEDGYIWGVFAYEPRVFFTTNYCSLCAYTLKANKDRYMYWWYVIWGKYKVFPV